MCFETRFDGGEKVSVTDGLWERVPEMRAAQLKAPDPMDKWAGGAVRRKIGE